MKPLMTFAALVMGIVGVVAADAQAGPGERDKERQGTRMGPPEVRRPAPAARPAAPGIRQPIPEPREPAPAARKPVHAPQHAAPAPAHMGSGAWPRTLAGALARRQAEERRRDMEQAQALMRQADELLRRAGELGEARDRVLASVRRCRGRPGHWGGRTSTPEAWPGVSQESASTSRP